MVASEIVAVCQVLKALPSCNKIVDVQVAGNWNVWYVPSRLVSQVFDQLPDRIFVNDFKVDGATGSVGKIIQVLDIDMKRVEFRYFVVDLVQDAFGMVILIFK